MSLSFSPRFFEKTPDRMISLLWPSFSKAHRVASSKNFGWYCSIFYPIEIIQIKPEGSSLSQHRYILHARLNEPSRWPMLFSFAPKGLKNLGILKVPLAFMTSRSSLPGGDFTPTVWVPTYESPSQTSFSSTLVPKTHRLLGARLQGVDIRTYRISVCVALLRSHGVQREIKGIRGEGLCIMEEVMAWLGYLGVWTYLSGWLCTFFRSFSESFLWIWEVQLVITDSLSTGYSLLSSLSTFSVRSAF